MRSDSSMVCVNGPSLLAGRTLLYMRTHRLSPMKKMGRGRRSTKEEGEDDDEEEDTVELDFVFAQNGFQSIEIAMDGRSK